MRAVDHRIIFVDGRIRRLAGQNEAGDFGRVAQALGGELIEAGAGADFAAGGKRSAGEEIAGLRAMDVAFAGPRHCKAR